MPTVRPITRALNAGEFSPLMEGRTDHARYPYSAKRLLNFLLTPQGPGIRRSGTEFKRLSLQQKPAFPPRLIPFVRSDAVTLMLEFARVGNNNGGVSEEADAFTGVVDTDASLDDDGLDDADLGAPSEPGGVGTIDPPAYGGALPDLPDGEMNNDEGDMGGVADAPAGEDAEWGGGSSIDPEGGSGEDPYYAPTLGAPAEDSASSGVFVIHDDDGVQRKDDDTIYKPKHPYKQGQFDGLRYTQSVDRMYFWHPDVRPKQLRRYGPAKWRWRNVKFIDGPYLPVNATKTKFSLNKTGVATATLNDSSDQTDGSDNETEAWKAFDGDPSTYWISTDPQKGKLRYDFGSGNAKVIKGYTIVAGRTFPATDGYLPMDYAPATWKFQGSNNGSTWTTLDAKDSYVAYQSYRTLYFDIKNTKAFRYYQLVVSGTQRGGNTQVIVAELQMVTSSSRRITIKASGTEGINHDDGFKNTDVGRVMRVRGSDNIWRWLEIVNVLSSTRCIAELQDSAFADTTPCAEWRLGVFSDTTGWPTCGCFYDDRLFMAGCYDTPDVISFTKSGGYGDKEIFSPSDAFGTVADDNGGCFFLNARTLSLIQWLEADDRVLLVGTRKGEHILRPGDNNVLGPKNIRSKQSSSRGSAPIEPVRVDQTLIFAQRTAKTLREIGYSYESDGYRAPSLSLYAQHIGRKKFAEMDYAAEPNSIVFVRRKDGVVATLTYAKEENVSGWGVFDFGKCERLAVKPSDNGEYDALWSVVTRNTYRTIEALRAPFDVDDTLRTGWFVDGGVSITPEDAEDNEDEFGYYIDKCHHLIGVDGVVGLIDGKKFEAVVRANGRVTLPYLPTQRALVGVGFLSEGVLSRPEVTSAGTIQGQYVRVVGLTLRLWNSFGGLIGVPATNQSVEDMQDMGLNEVDEIAEPVMFSGDKQVGGVGADTQGDGTIMFRQPADQPYPLNIVALIPATSVEYVQG